MKTILIPTDYSAVAKNAAHYGAEVALAQKAKIILLYVYQMPIVMGEIPVTIPSMQEIETDSMVGLEKLKKHLLTKYGENLTIDCVCKSGFITDSICETAEEINADLIIVGMQGAGFITEKIMGSNTTSLIQRSKIPVLAVDKHAHFKSIENILFASDYLELKDKNVLAPLLSLVKSFNANLQILHVTKEVEKNKTITKAVEGIKLDHYFEDVPHEFHFIDSENVLEGIKKFIKKNPVDMIVMIPRSHSFVNKLINEPHSKQMAFHTHLPLLTIHE